MLFVEDLVDAFLLAQANMRTLSGQAFNIGGGLGNTISLLELLEMIGSLQWQEARKSRWTTGELGISATTCPTRANSRLLQGGPQKSAFVKG